MIYLISILFTLSFIFYSKYQFIDKMHDSHEGWHIYGWIMRILLFSAFFFPANWKDILLAIAISLPLFDLGINKISLNKPYLYIGFTNFWDKTLGKAKWYIYLALLIAATLLKTNIL